MQKPVSFNGKMSEKPIDAFRWLLYYGLHFDVITETNDSFTASVPGLSIRCNQDGKHVYRSNAVTASSQVTACIEFIEGIAGRFGRIDTPEVSLAVMVPKQLYLTAEMLKFAT